MEVGITGPAHPAWEVKEDNGPCMKVFFTNDDGSHLPAAIGILHQEGFKFEHFVHAVWPGASIVKWRWDKSCRGKGDKRNNNEDQETSNVPILVGIGVCVVILALYFNIKRTN